jgi:hypothetical protein
MSEQKIIDTEKEFGKTGSGLATKYIENQLRKEVLMRRALALFILALT